MNENFVQCPICGKKFGALTYAHIKIHYGSEQGYWNKFLSEYPGIVLHSEKTLRKIGEASKGRKGGMLGKHHSEETKRKISEGKKDRSLPPFSEEHKRRISEALCGRNFSEERRQKISESCKGRPPPSFSDEHRCKLSEAAKERYRDRTKNPNWQGGISFEPYDMGFDRNLKKKVKKRDKYTCQLCFRHALEFDRELAVHHIDYDKRHSSMDNLVTLCCGCNIHVNYRRSFWTAFFRDRLRERGLLAMEVAR